MCECGIIVVMRRLLRKGLPLSCCIAYMLAGPIINLVVIFSTWVAFRDHKIGPEMVGLRVGLGFIVACVTGLVVQRQYRRYGNALLTPVAAPRDVPTPVASRPVATQPGEAANEAAATEAAVSPEPKKTAMGTFTSDRKSTRLNSSHGYQSRMPSSA